MLTEVLREALQTHETAVVLPLSGRMSGTVEGFRAAAREVGEERVMVLESKSVTIGLGLLALRLQALLERGCTAGEAQAALAQLSDDHRVVFSLETLEFLQRGGRVGRAQAVAGSLLRVRPILQFDDGEVAPHSRVRGSHRVMPVMREYLVERSDPDRRLHVALGHTRRPEVLPELEEMVRAAHPRASIDLVSEIGPTVGTHAGPGAYAVAFVHDPLDDE
jgi:DegV family protein with EDD domain